jgi:hypothetical protein
VDYVDSGQPDRTDREPIGSDGAASTFRCG